MPRATAPYVPLESGDRLTRAEFHARYCARPDIKKAELVEGVVYVASPVRHRQHGNPHAAMIGWLYSYAAHTPGVQFSDNATVFLDGDNEVQPDACLFYDPPRPGGARLTDEGYIEGAPQFVGETSASTASYDLHDKLRAYQRSSVLEYVAWRVIDGQIDWRRLVNGEYILIQPDEHGIIESTVFPGLRLNVTALLAGSHAAVLATLEAGLRERDASSSSSSG
jgi:Uma2 family endonuclease